ncbi:MAG TPA: metal ABC transporter substrate-binding protein [Limnochordales bacterium]
MLTIGTAAAAASLMAASLEAGARAAVAVRRAVTTTTILEDLVRQVAGEAWSVVSLIPVGADPHAYQPGPADAKRLAGAELVVMVGAGLEPAALSRLVKSAPPEVTVLELAPRVALRWDEIAAEGDEASGGGHAHEHGEKAGWDPHFWWSAPRVAMAVELIADSLARIDPAGEAGYRARAAAYRERLRALDGWIRQQVATIPPERRLLVTNHDALGHLAVEYGFTVVGTVLPGTSTLAEASAAGIARLLQRIRSLPVGAIFAEATASPVVAERVSREAGLPLVTLYTGSLGPPGSGAETYEGFMHTNVRRIVEALRP